jgi:hypothetical protein
MNYITVGSNYNFFFLSGSNYICEKHSGTKRTHNHKEGAPHKHKIRPIFLQLCLPKTLVSSKQAFVSQYQYSNHTDKLKKC